MEDLVEKLRESFLSCWRSTAFSSPGSKADRFPSNSRDESPIRRGCEDQVTPHGKRGAPTGGNHEAFLRRTAATGLTPSGRAFAFAAPRSRTKPVASAGSFSSRGGARASRISTLASRARGRRSRPSSFPAYDDRDPRKKAPALFLKAAAQAGIPRAAIEDFGLRKAPFWPGSQHPRCYRRPDYLKPLTAWHAWIRFREPVQGPLAIGAGRHCGLGLFAICE